MAEETDLIALTIDVVSSYVGANNMRPDDLPSFIAKTHEAIKALGSPAETEAPAQSGQDYAPAVTVRKSLASRDHIVSMIDGKPYKTLRRHLSTHGLTPEQYRERYGLKKDYPMVAPSYAETRRALAHKIGLGRKAKDVAGAVVEAAEQVIEKVVPKKGRGGAKGGLAALKGVRERNKQPEAEAPSEDQRPER